MVLGFNLNFIHFIISRLLLFHRLFSTSSTSVGDQTTPGGGCGDDAVCWWFNLGMTMEQNTIKILLLGWARFELCF